MNRRLAWWFTLLVQSVVTYLLWTDAAQADPISSAIITAFSLTGFAATLVQVAVFATAVLAVTALAKVSTKKTSGSADGGIKQSMSTGGSTYRTFILGEYATGGQLVTPPESYGTDGDTPNAYLTYVIELGSIPGQTLTGLIFNDNYVEVGSSLVTIGGSSQQGYPILGDFEGYAWIRYHDGSQTAVDALLHEKFSGSTAHPWGTNMIGYGCPYAVLVFKYNTDIYQGFPTIRFQIGGIPLYDPRKDSTVGGSGSHRWGTASTYEQTKNPAVIIYNLHRGITMPDGQAYGGECEAEDLPLDNWFAAMNECDLTIENADGSTEPQFEGGAEISIDTTPADAITAFEKACMAQQFESGGVWKIRVGPPGLPVVNITDEDILVDHDQDHDLFTAIDDANNGITGTYTEPDALWDSKDAPARYNPEWEEEDGKRIVEDVSLLNTFSVTQAQRIMAAAIAEDRRFRKHNFTLPPYCSQLEVLDTIAWTSVREGYTSKQFEISQTTEGFYSLLMTTSIRERDSSDYNWSADDELPSTPTTTGSVIPQAQSVPGWAVTGVVIKDSTGVARRPAIELAWSGSGLVDVKGLFYQIRLKQDSSDVGAGYVSDIGSNGVIVSEGVLASTTYQVRGQLDVERPTVWTLWTDVTTPDVRLSQADLDDAVNDAIDTANTNASDALAQVSALASQVEADLDMVQAQISDLAGTATYDKTRAYQAGDAIKGGDGILYTAIIDVPAADGAHPNGYPPPNATYWKVIGAYASVGDALSALAVSTATNATNITTTNNNLAAEVTNRQTLATQLRGSYTGTDPALLSSGLIYNTQTVLSSADAANAALINSVQTSLTNTQTTVTSQGTAIGALQTTTTNQGNQINTLTTNYTSLSATVAGKADTTALNALSATVTSQGNDISTLSTNYSSLSTTVAGKADASALNALSVTVTNQGNSINTLTSNYTTLSTTVGNHTTSITALQSAQIVTDGNVTSMQAVMTMFSTVDGKLSGYKNYNDGSYSAWNFYSDYFSISAGSTGARTEFSDGNWRVYDNAGVLRVRMGVWTT